MQCLENVDSGGFDLGQITGKSVDEMYKICLNLPFAVAWNSQGFVKYHVSRLTPSPGCKLYIVSKPFRQYMSKYLPPIWCINLQRRQDRKNSMLEKESKLQRVVDRATNSSLINFYTAVDGSQLTMTPDIQKMFAGNDFGFRRGVIGAALSHWGLWKQLLTSNEQAYLIIEDDVEFCDDFMAKYSHAMAQVNGIDPGWDFLYLGFSLYNRKQFEKDLWNDKFPLVTPFDNALCFGAGFFGYVVSKSGAQKLVDYIAVNGIQRAIDCIPPTLPNVKRYSCIPNIIQTPCFGPGMENVDTDIQRDFTRL